MPPKSPPPRVSCTRPGCSSSCPLRVVLRGLAPGGVPARCFDCGRPFKKPPGVDGTANKDKRGGGLKEQEMQRLRDEIKALKSKRGPAVQELRDEVKALKAKHAAATGEPEPTTADTGDDDIKARIQRLTSFIQEIQSACDKSPSEEHKQFLELQRARLRDLRKQQDAGLGMHERVRKQSFRVSEAAKKVENLKECAADLRKELEELEARRARTAAKLEEAQRELVQEQAVAQRLSDEAVGHDPPADLQRVDGIMALLKAAPNLEQAGQLIAQLDEAFQRVKATTCPATPGSLDSSMPAAPGAGAAVLQPGGDGSHHGAPGARTPLGPGGIPLSPGEGDGAAVANAAGDRREARSPSPGRGRPTAAARA